MVEGRAAKHVLQFESQVYCIDTSDTYLAVGLRNGSIHVSELKHASPLVVVTP